MDEKNPLGIFTNTDALSDRVLERLSKSVRTVLKVADEETMITNITVPNEPDGMEIIFHTQTQDMAFVKPELAETPSQKRLNQLKAEDRLRRWEVRLAISDEAMKNKKANAGDLIGATNAGKAFAKAMNAEGFLNMYNGVAGVNAAAPWNAATDAQIEDDINTALDQIDDEGFTGDTILLNRMQWGRLHRVANIVNTGMKVEDWLNEFGLTPMRVRNINYKNNAGTLINLFSPVGNTLIFDKRAYSVFTQEPMTGDVENDVKIGATVAYLRKYFRTTPVQTEAAYRISGVGY